MVWEYIRFKQMVAQLGAGRKSANLVISKIGQHCGWYFSTDATCVLFRIDLFYFYERSTKQRSKRKHQRMSNRSGKEKELSTKEDKLTTSTLFLLQDNKLKLHAINKLNKVRSTIEGFHSAKMYNFCMGIFYGRYAR